MNGIYNASQNVFTYQQSMHQYIILTKVISGAGSVSEMGKHAKKLNRTHALIVTDSIIHELRMTEPITDSLKKAGLKVSVFDEIEENPHWQTIDRGGQYIKDNGCDIVVAIGGGSSIDGAKAMAMMGNNKGSILDWEG